MIMEDDMTIQIKRDDGSIVSVAITPLHTEEDGKRVPIRVFELASSSINDIGEIAFHLEDPHRWEYCGNVLTDDEIEQVVLAIQNVLV